MTCLSNLHNGTAGFPNWTTNDRCKSNATWDSRRSNQKGTLAIAEREPGTKLPRAFWREIQIVLASETRSRRSQTRSGPNRTCGWHGIFGNWQGGPEAHKVMGLFIREAVTASISLRGHLGPNWPWRALRTPYLKQISCSEYLKMVTVSLWASQNSLAYHEENSHM